MSGTYFRNTSPSTGNLYSATDTEPRSLLVVSHSAFLNSFVGHAFPRVVRSLYFADAHLSRRWPAHWNSANRPCRRVLLVLTPPWPTRSRPADATAATFARRGTGLAEMA
jgi:hypothetical protein